MRVELRLSLRHPHWGLVWVLPMTGTSSSLLCLHCLATFGSCEAADHKTRTATLTPPLLCIITVLPHLEYHLKQGGHVTTVTQSGKVHQACVNGISLPLGPVTSQLVGTWEIFSHPHRGYVWWLHLRDMSRADRIIWWNISMYKAAQFLLFSCIYS